jgi:GNAT superfamily N-acetyltransferase
VYHILTIKKLTDELISDYINYHQNIALADDLEWAGCFCVWYFWTENLEEERQACDLTRQKNFKRDLAEKLIREKTLIGYLAFSGKDVVGWCNAGNRSRFDRLNRDTRPELWSVADSRESIKSIVCSTIAPKWRGKGIATRLLEYTCGDSLHEGFTIIEAYPGNGIFNERSYHETISMYLKQGFYVYKKSEEETVVRKRLA